MIKNVDKLILKASQELAANRKNQARALYTQAAELGSADACYALAKMLLATPSYKMIYDSKETRATYLSLLRWLEKAFELGHNEAAFTLAKVHLEGVWNKPVSKDEGMQWLKKAVESGNAEAKAYLDALQPKAPTPPVAPQKSAQPKAPTPPDAPQKPAQPTAQKPAAPKNHAKVVSHQSGVEISQGYMVNSTQMDFMQYYMGMAPTPTPAKPATEKGGMTAEQLFYLARDYFCGNNRQKIDKKQGEKYYQLAAQKGHAVALAICLLDGYGMAKDHARAVRILMQEVQTGSAAAQNCLAFCYAKGEGVKQDYAEAVKWYRLSAAQGNASAQYNLGYCYAKGEGVKQDYAEAVKWYRLAAAQGNAAAQNNLGNCYYYGEGVKQD